VCTWMTRSSQFGDALGGHDRLRLEEDLEEVDLKVVKAVNLDAVNLEMVNLEAVDLEGGTTGAETLYVG